TSDVPDSRIDQHVEQIDHDIDDDEGNRHGQGHALDEIGLVIADPIHDQHAHAIDVEDNLDDHRATHEVTDAQAENGNRGDERIAQNVATNNDVARNACAERRADVVLIEFFNHSGADDAR